MSTSVQSTEDDVHVGGALKGLGYLVPISLTGTLRKAHRRPLV